MNDVKLKASEYASLTGLSINTVKNRIRAGVLKGAKEEDGVWYVYLTKDEYEHLIRSKESQEESGKVLQSNLEGLRSTLEGNLIATYMSALMQKEQQKEQLLHELSSLYTLLAIREKEMEFMLKEQERLKGRCSQLEEENKRLLSLLEEREGIIKELENQLREKDYVISQKELELQKVSLDKERELLNKELELTTLRRELERKKGRAE